MPNKGLAIMAGGKAAAPAKPTLSYSAENQFTITNYDTTVDYVLTGCTRAGNIITPSSSTATVASKYPRALVNSAAAQGLTAVHTRVLTTVSESPASQGCGPRPSTCCTSGILAVDGHTCEGTGTQVPDGWCNNECIGWCFGLYLTCYNYYWTDYSGSGYALIGSTWGKAA